MRILLIIVEMINEVCCFRSLPLKHFNLDQRLINKDLPVAWQESLSHLGVEQLTLAALLQLIIISHKRVFVNWPRGLHYQMAISKTQPNLLVEVDQVLHIAAQPLPKYFFWKSFKARLFRQFKALVRRYPEFKTVVLALGLYVGTFVLTLAIIALIKVLS